MMDGAAGRLLPWRHHCVVIELNGQPEKKVDDVLERLGATAPADPRLRINLDLLVRARSARHDGARMRNFADAIERLGIGGKPIEQVIDRLAHHLCRLGAPLDETRLDSVALGPPFVFYGESAVDGTKIGIQFGVVEQMPRQATKERRDTKPIL